MSVVVEAKDEAEFMEYCHSENIEVTHVADVTDTERMRMFYGDKIVADLQRKFIDSAPIPSLCGRGALQPSSSMH